MADDKQIRWVGSAYDDLLAFPEDSRREAGLQLGKVQAGLDPADWKPFDDVGAGTREIRIKDASGICRVMYVANSRKQFTCCIASGRRRRRPASRTKLLRKLAIVLS